MLRQTTIFLALSLVLVGCQSTTGSNNATTNNSAVVHSSNNGSNTAYEYNKWQHDWFSRNTKSH